MPRHPQALLRNLASIKRFLIGERTSDPQTMRSYHFGIILLSIIVSNSCLVTTAGSPAQAKLSQSSKATLVSRQNAAQALAKQIIQAYGGAKTVRKAAY